MSEVYFDSFKMEYIDDVINLWNNTLIYDLIDYQKFYDSILMDENFETTLFQVAKLDKKIIGFCFGIKRKIPYLERGTEPTRGWINMLAVDSNFQHQGIGSALLKLVENKLKSLGAKEITLCAYSPNYFTPGIDIRYETGNKFFQDHGYVIGSEAVSMHKDLFTFTPSEDYYEKLSNLNKQGYQIIPFEKKYTLQLMDYTLNNFGAGWKRNVMMNMQTHQAEQTTLLCVDNTNQIVGFCTSKIDGRDERFGPIGISESLRSKGLGGILFESMMIHMKSRGIPSLYFLWTSGAAQRFYERHGVSVYRKYYTYRKALN